MLVSRNIVCVLPDRVLKLHRFKGPFGTSIARWLLTQITRSREIAYESPSRRRDFEAFVLRQWENFGLSAPKLIRKVGISGVELERIAGPLIKDELLFRDRLEGMNLVSCILAEMADRHELVLRERAPELVHFDSNLTNLIYCTAQDVVYHIDFESFYPGKERLELIDCCERELAKFVVSLREIMCDEDVMLGLSSYRFKPVLMRAKQKWSGNLTLRLLTDVL